MATQLQMRRGTQSEHTSFTGAEGEVSVNTTNESLHVHNGSAAGGFELARADLDNVSDSDLNAALTGNTIGSLTITTADITNLSLGGVSVTSTAAELNYVDGVTSAIQTQIDTKAPIANPTFTGSFTSPGIDDNATSTAITIDSSENVGIGVVPETWQSTIDALQVGLGGSFAGNTVNPSRVYLSANYYINSSNQESYIATDEASQYFQNAGTHTFKVAPSGTADSAISWITAATIDNSGNLLVGKTSASTNTVGVEARTDGTFAAVKSSGGAVVFGRNTDDGTIVTFRKDGAAVGSIGTASNDLNIDGGASHSGIRFQAGSLIPRLNGADTDNTIDLGYDAGGATHRWKDLYMSGVAAMGGASYDSTKTIKAETVGTANTNYAFYGIGTQTGANGRLNFWEFPNTNDSSAYFVFAQNSSGNCFNIRGDGDVENTNNAYNGVSDEKLKENVAEASSQWDDLKAVQVRKYSFKSDNLDSPNQLGVIAQELEASGMGGLVKESPDVDMRTGEDLGTTTKTVKYSVLYMKAVKALQEAMTRIETLEAKVQQLENN